MGANEFMGGAVLQFLVLTILIFGSTSVRAHQRTCESIFFSAQPTHRLGVESTQALLQLTDVAAGDTTSLRVEDKTAVSIFRWRRFRQVVEENISRLEERDLARSGKVNVTDTAYVSPFSYELDGRELSGKLRVRTYLEENLRNHYVTRAPITAEGRFLEIKYDHPMHDQASVKPRVLLSDRDLRAILDPRTSQIEVEAIRARATANPINKPMVVERIFTFVRALQREQGENWQTEYVRTAYRRKAYRVTVERNDDANGPRAPLDIQITVDQNIELLTYEGRLLARLGKGVRVVEVKVPLLYGELNLAQVLDAPGLNAIKYGVELLLAGQRDDMVAQRGKFGNFLRILDPEEPSDAD